jgi:hypothetical protein
MRGVVVANRDQLRSQRRVFGNPLGVKLKFDPLGHAHASNRFYIVWTRTERQSVQRLQDLLIFGKFASEAPNRIPVKGSTDRE